MTTALTRPTYDDVNLILRLYEMRRDDRLREARRWFASSFRPKSLDEFMALCPPGSEPNASYRMLTTYWEMAAAFVTSGVLNQDLFFQTNREFLLVWERLRDLIPELRAQVGNPTELANLEAVSKAYIEWWNKRAPGAYEAFSRRVRG